MKILSFSSLLILFALISPSSFAQFTSASLFPEMKAINPAVIGQRSIGIFSAGLARENYEKTQDLSSNFGVGAEGKSDIELTESRFFYGGKKGGFLTSEVQALIASGEKVDNVSQPGASNQKVTNSVSNQYINIGLGLGEHFGVSFSRLVFENDQAYNFDFGGTNYSGGDNSEVTGLVFRGGMLINLGLDIGLYYEHAQATITSEGTNGSTETSSNYPKVGIGLGFNGKSSRMEIGYERDLKAVDDPATQKSYTANKMYIALEGRFGGLTLGYTGALYREGFFELENLLRQNLVFQGTREEDRLVNTINFALGNTKGHSFSAGAFFSTVETPESGQLFSDGFKYPTTTESLGVSVKYGYSW